MEDREKKLEEREKKLEDREIRLEELAKTWRNNSRKL